MPIYKNYDIRGVYPEEINEELVEKIGIAFVHYLHLQGKTVVVARDARTHSPLLFESLIKGLTSAGANVIDVGLATTPLFYYSVFSLTGDAGIMVTASHNPAKYNGLKMTIEGAKPFGGEDILELKKLVESTALVLADTKGNLQQKNTLNDYVITLLTLVPLDKKLKVVIDLGNGMGGRTIKPLLDNTPLQVTYLYDEIDMSFPNHEANPLKKSTLVDLQKKVVEVEADLGVAFDGDSDRIGFVDEQGEIILMDHVTALIAQDTLIKHPGAAILYDIRSSWIVKEVIEKNGGVAIESKVGHTNIKKLMHEKDVLFAGEVSGHYYYDEMNKTDNAALSMLKVLHLLAESDKPFSEVMKPFQLYFKSEETNFEVENKDTVIKKLKENYSDGILNELDGIRIDYPHWWFNVRKSNTESLLRLIIEAKTKELMEEKLEELKKIITT